MGYPAKKGMYSVKAADGGHLYRFQEPGTAPGLPAKRWFKVEVLRRVFDSKGAVVKRDKQVTNVFATEDTVVGLGVRRCPDPWPASGEEVKVSVYYRTLGEGDSF